MFDLAVRRDPFGSLFDDFFDDFFGRARSAVAQRAAELPPVVRARMDVVDKGDKYAITLDLPGVKKEDISVSVEGARVSVSAESKTEKEAKDGERVLRAERFAARYARSFELPAEVSEEGAEAKFENGVLQLSLPKRAQLVSKRLTIQ
jgi:HSP20 family protein